MKSALTALAVFTLLTSSISSMAMGTLYFSADLPGPGGLYTLDTATGVATYVGVNGVTGNTVGLSEGPNSGILLGSKPFGLTHINAGGSGITDIAPGTYEGLAYDPTTGKAYGSWINGDGFWEIDPATGARAALPVPTVPGASNVDVEGLAYVDGYIYGLAGFFGPQGDLWRYSIASSIWSFVGNTGVLFSDCGLAYDPDLGLLYGIGSQDDLLYTIDPASAAASIIGSTGLGPVGGGLAFVRPGSAVPDAGATALLMACGCLALSLMRGRRD